MFTRGDDYSRAFVESGWRAQLADDGGELLEATEVGDGGVVRGHGRSGWGQPKNIKEHAFDRGDGCRGTVPGSAPREGVECGKGGVAHDVRGVRRRPSRARSAS